MTELTPAPVPLDSTTLSTATYDDRGGRLRLDFRDGSRYEYSGVARELFSDLLRAPSKGSFFNRHIRGRFAYVKLTNQN